MAAYKKREEFPEELMGELSLLLTDAAEVIRTRAEEEGGLSPKAAAELCADLLQEQFEDAQETARTTEG